MSENTDSENAFQDLNLELRDIIDARKKQGSGSAEAESSRNIWEAFLGRDLSKDELENAIRGVSPLDKIREIELPSDLRAEEHAHQLKDAITKIIDSPYKFEAALHAVDSLDSSKLKTTLGGARGRFMVGLLSGGLDSEPYQERLAKALMRDDEGLSQEFREIIRDIQDKEKALMPTFTQDEVIGLEKVYKKHHGAKEGQESWGGGMSIEGAATDQVQEFVKIAIVNIHNIPDDDEKTFNRVKQIFSADTDILYAIQVAHGVNTPECVSAQEKWYREIGSIDNIQEYKQKAIEFLGNLGGVLRNPQERHQEDISGKEKKGKKSLKFKIPAFADERVFNRDPTNVRELALWIVASDDAKTWSPEGIYPLFELSTTETEIVTKTVDARTGEVEVQKATFREDNFIRWLRNKMIELHNDNSKDPMSPLQAVGIKTVFSTVNLLEMKYNKQKYFSDAETGRILTGLYDEVINSAFIFGVRRNSNLAYSQVMTSDEKLFEGIVALNSKDEHTTGNNLAGYIQQSDSFNRDQEGVDADNKVGDALLVANQIYRNISDSKRLREILPADSAIFTAEGFKDAIRVLQSENFDAEVTGYGNNIKVEGNRIYYRYPKTGLILEIFDENGILKSDDNLIEFLNIFTTPNPEESTENLLRELVRLSAGRFVGLEDGTSKEHFEIFKRKIEEQEDINIDELPTEKRKYKIKQVLGDYRKLSRINLEWAEINSWVEQRWSGAAARNDTGYRGYDAWTKMYAQYYRERQSQPGTSGPIGNPKDIQIFKMLSPDMWLSLRTESGQVAQEIFDEIHDINKRLYSLSGQLTLEEEQTRQELIRQKENAHNRLRFQRGAQLDWASNGVKRQSEVWHAMLNTEDLGFDKLVTRDVWGVIKYNRSEFEKVVKDGFIKIRRYAFKSNNAMNYGAMTRFRERVRIDRNPDGSIKKEHFEFKDKFLADAMFGDVVMKSLREGWYGGDLKFEDGDEKGEKRERSTKNATFQEYLNSDNARDRLLKNMCRAGLAAQLMAHRSRTGTGERWNPTMIKKFYASLRSMPQFIEDPETGEEISIPGSQFFSKEDIEWIKEYTGTTDSSLFLEDSLSASAEMASMLPEIFGIFFSSVVSS